MSARKTVSLLGENLNAVELAALLEDPSFPPSEVSEVHRQLRNAIEHEQDRHGSILSMLLPEEPWIRSYED